MATLGLAGSAILGGALVSAMGEAAQGQAAKGQAKFEAAVQQQQATRERQVAAGEERDFRRSQSALLARRRAVLGASGIDLSSGSPLLATSDFAREAELQAQRIRAGGATRATRLEQQAQLTKAAGVGAVEGSYLRAGSSLLSGAGRAFGG